MGKDEQTNQLNLTVVALVALVAIVGLVALVMNAVSFKTAQLATGSKLASATTDAQQNSAGKVFNQIATTDYWANEGGVDKCTIGTACEICLCKNGGSQRACMRVCGAG